MPRLTTAICSLSLAACAEWTASGGRSVPAPIRYGPVEAGIAIHTTGTPEGAAFAVETGACHRLATPMETYFDVQSYEPRRLSQPEELLLTIGLVGDLGGGAAVFAGSFVAAPADRSEVRALAYGIWGLAALGATIALFDNVVLAHRKRELPGADLPTGEPKREDAPCRGPTEPPETLHVTVPFGAFDIPVATGVARLTIDWAATKLNPFDPATATILAGNWTITTDGFASTTWMPTEADVARWTTALHDGAMSGPPPELRVAGVSTNGDVVAGAPNDITIAVHNGQHAGIAYDVTAIAHSRVFATDLRFAVGRIDPGESKPVTVKAVPLTFSNKPSGWEQFDVRVELTDIAHPAVQTDTVTATVTRR